jgi:hypothetical protein
LEGGSWLRMASGTGGCVDPCGHGGIGRSALAAIIVRTLTSLRRRALCHCQHVCTVRVSNPTIAILASNAERRIARASLSAVAIAVIKHQGTGVLTHGGGGLSYVVDVVLSMWELLGNWSRISKFDLSASVCERSALTLK